MAHFFIQSPHTPAECMRALDEVATDPNLLKNYEWGCMAGHHTGYANVEASSETDAQKFVPNFLRGKAQIIKVDRFNTDQIREMHKK